jgi:hypothetical protein
MFALTSKLLQGSDADRQRVTAIPTIHVSMKCIVRGCMSTEHSTGMVTILLKLASWRFGSFCHCAVMLFGGAAS